MVLTLVGSGRWVEFNRRRNTKSRARIIRQLAKGNAIRATSPIADVSKNTVSKRLADAGRACTRFHDENVRGVEARHVQADEIWSFCDTNAKNVEKSEICTL